MSKVVRNKPFAYGESSYDFTGRRESKPYLNAVSETPYREGQETNIPAAKDTTTKTLLLLAGGAIVVTGLLIWLLGRRKK